MKIGVTATQRGLSPQQQAQFYYLLLRDEFPEEFHHGGCIRGDDWLQFIVFNLRGIYANKGCKLIMHRGDTPEKWANCDEFQDEIHEPKPNLERNKDIVNGCHELWAFPGEHEEILRSGTWATVRYARDKAHKPVTIIFPDGTRG